jgi:hypothetical protein
MNRPNTVTLWEVICEIPYYEDYNELIEDLQKRDKFQFTEEQDEQFQSFVDELRELITGLNERDAVLFENTGNGAEDADLICDILKLNHYHPTIVYDKSGVCTLNTYLYATA